MCVLLRRNLVDGLDLKDERNLVTGSSSVWSYESDEETLEVLYKYDASQSNSSTTRFSQDRATWKGAPSSLVKTP